MSKPKIIVICGPTASGKTKLGIELAKKINGEIISCDSMQIYKDMTIGTAKPNADEMEGIKHYLIDFVSPEQRYSVAEFNKDANIAIKEILSKGKKPILVGGTGLYIDSLIYGINYNDIKIDEKYRAELEQIANNGGLKNLYEEVTRMKVYDRQPYSGKLVFAAFSGSHQDAIAKGMKWREEKHLNEWTVPYLPIDPRDLGRVYETDVIRINSQSGKGGVAYILENNYSYKLPKKLSEEVSYLVKSV